MPQTKQTLTEPEYNNIHDTIIDDIIKEIVSEHALPDEYTYNDWVVGALDTYYDEHLTDYTYRSIANYADNKRFDPYNDITLNCSADHLIESIARQTVRADLIKTLQRLNYNIRTTVTIHTHLHDRTTGPDYNQSPSDLLDDFNRWLVLKRDSDPDTYPKIDYETFNETHIRGHDILPYHNEAILEAIYDWLHDTDDTFPPELPEI